MTLLVTVSFFILGAIIASFVGVLAARLYTGQGFVAGRSQCDACAAPLTALALVPIISHLLSRGRAICCRARISWASPVAEAVLGSLFALSYLRLGLTLALTLFLVALALLLGLVLYDLAHHILPAPLLVVFVLVSALFALVTAPSYAALVAMAGTALGTGAILALIHYASRGRAMGFADAPLAFGLSLLVGSSALTGFVFSFWIGAVVGIALLFGRPAGTRMGVEVPFAPFLASGFLLAFFTQWNLSTIVAAASRLWS